MKKKIRKTVHDQMMEGMADAVAFARGQANTAKYRVHVPSDVDVKAIRKTLCMSQTEFCSRFGFGLASVRDWEQGRYRPDSVARAYLIVISRAHRAVEKALSSAA